MVHRRLYLLPIIFFSLILIFSSTCAGEPQKVLVLDISDSITPVSDDIVLDAIFTAETEGFEALIITLNTPGGGLDETFNIIESIDQTDVPVIGYV